MYSISSLRYGKNEESVYHFYRKITDDPFSFIVEQSGGTIYMDYEGSHDPPRLLVEDLKKTFDQTHLMKDAIPFFFPELSVSSITPAFGREECFFAIDKCDLTNVIIFDFVSFGDHNHVNLLLHGKFQMDGWTQEELEAKITETARCLEWTPEMFTEKAAKFLRETLGPNHVEKVMTDVMAFRCDGWHEFMEFITKRPWPNDSLTQLIQKMGATVYDHTLPFSYDRSIICKNLTRLTKSELTRLIHASIHCLYPAFHDIKPAFNPNEKLSYLCWCAKNEVDQVVLICFNYNKQTSRGSDSKYSLDVHHLCTGNLDMENLLRTVKARSTWPYVKDASHFSDVVFIQAGKELKRLMDEK